MRALQLLKWLSERPAEILLLPPIAILFAMAAFWWVRRSFLLRAYDAIAARTGLTVVRRILNGSDVRGTFAGRAIVVSTTERRRQTLRRRWTRVSATLTNPEAIGLHMWRQDAVDRVILAAGGHEVIVGDAEFDRRFVIRSRDEAVVRKMFADQDVRDLIIRADIDSVELLSTVLHAYYPRSERDPEHAETLFRAVTSLADAIDSLGPDYQPEIIRS